MPVAGLASAVARPAGHHEAPMWCVWRRVMAAAIGTDEADGQASGTTGDDGPYRVFAMERLTASARPRVSAQGNDPDPPKTLSRGRDVIHERRTGSSAPRLSRACAITRGALPIRRRPLLLASASLVVVLGAVLASAAPASAQRRVIRPDGAPADRPYSPGVLAGQTLYISGQLGLPGTGPTPAAMDAQARQAMDGVGAVLKAAGLGYQHLVKCHVYLASMDDYAAMNAAYGSYFTDRVPARTTVQAVALPAGAGVQIACIALRGPRAHLGGAPAGRIAAGAARSVLARRVGGRHALRLRHGRAGSGDQGGGGVGRGAGHADGRQHHDDAEGRRARACPTSSGRRATPRASPRRRRCESTPCRRGHGAARHGRAAAAAGADPRRADVRRHQGRRDRRSTSTR